MTGLDVWRAAKLECVRVADAHDIERVTIGAAVRAAYVAAATPKQRATFVPCPGAPCSFSALAAAYAQWREVLGKTAKGKAAREAADDACKAYGDRFAAMADEGIAVRRALDTAAMDIDAPVIGDGAAWHMIHAVYESRYATQGLGSSHYARAAATLHARDLIEVGYRVRCVTRGRPARLPRGPYGTPGWAWEVWAWTCDEGAEIAPHQRPARSLADDLRRARDEGVNPAALWPVPMRLVEAAGADLATHHRPVPVVWEQLADGAPLPEIRLDGSEATG